MSLSFDRLLNFYERACFDPISLTALAATAGSALASAAPALGAVGTVASLAGAGLGAAGTLAAGNNAKAMGIYQQKEYNMQADTATATGQRGMLEERRKAGLVQSRLVAQAGASGVDPTSGSVLSLSGDIAKRGEYNALMDLSQGQNQAAGLRNQGSAARYGGNIAQEGDEWGAAGTLAGGVGSAFRGLSYASGGSPTYTSSGGYPPISYAQMGDVTYPILGN